MWKILFERFCLCGEIIECFHSEISHIEMEIEIEAKIEEEYTTIIITAND